LAPNGSPQEQTQAFIGLITEVGDEVGVEIAPRYGSWDPDNAVVDLPPNDLSTPGATPVPSRPELLVPDAPSQG
jgi:hypothetical protein